MSRIHVKVWIGLALARLAAYEQVRPSPSPSPLHSCQLRGQQAADKCAGVSRMCVWLLVGQSLPQFLCIFFSLYSLSLFVFFSALASASKNPHDCPPVPVIALSPITELKKKDARTRLVTSESQHVAARVLEGQAVRVAARPNPDWPACVPLSVCECGKLLHHVGIVLASCS